MNDIIGFENLLSSFHISNHCFLHENKQGLGIRNIRRCDVFTFALFRAGDLELPKYWIIKEKLFQT